MRWEPPCERPKSRLSASARGAHVALAGGTSAPDDARRWVACAARAWREGARGVLLHLPLAAAQAASAAGLGALPARTQVVFHAPPAGRPWPQVADLPPRASVLVTLTPSDPWEDALRLAAAEVSAMAARAGATVGLLLALGDGDVGEGASPSLNLTAEGPHAEAAAPLEGLRRALARLAEVATAHGLPVGFAPDAGPPRCLAPPPLQRRRRAPNAFTHSVRSFGRACARCAWARACPGVPQGWLRAPAGSEALRPPAGASGDDTPARAARAAARPWRDRAREVLLGHPDAVLELREVIPPATLPPRPCVLPWTRLEMSPSGEFGPCCSDYQATPTRAPRDASPQALWQGEALAAFRRALASPAAPPSTCRVSCALRAAGVTALSQLKLRGGPAPWVDAQLAAVEDAMEGQTAPRSPPLALMIAPTTYCNFDCLMCHYGEEGTLEDELGEAYYDHVRTLLPTLGRLEAVGGEPMASPAFRRFLRETDFGRAPQLEVALVTNGSYLTPRRIRALAHVPFAALTISLNAARPETYEAVNRGVPFGHIRHNLNALIHGRRARAPGRADLDLVYSMVILRRNIAEIEDFAQLAWEDGARPRFRLPNRNRNRQSIMTRPDLMGQALQALERVARARSARSHLRADDELRGTIRVLRDRLQRKVFVPL